MRRFVGTILLAMLPVFLLLGGYATWRMRIIQRRARACFDLEPECRVLVLGDSHADASFVEDPQLGIRIAGHHSSPLVFSLMRLKEIERRGGLEHVKVCVVNFCHTTTGALTYDAVRRSAWYFFPYSLRYRDWIPLGSCDLYGYLLDYVFAHPTELPKVAWRPAYEENRPSILERSASQVAEDLEMAIKRHFSWKNDDLADVIPGWEAWLRRAMREMKTICDRHSVKLLFFTSPLSEAYRANIPVWAKENLASWVAEARQLGILYYDYSASCGPEMLRDSNHIRLQCAPQFTQKFYREVLADLVDGQRGKVKR